MRWLTNPPADSPRTAMPNTRLTEAEAHNRGFDVKVGRFPVASLAHHLADRDEVAWRTGELFDANVFYPWRNVLAYSDHLIGQSWQERLLPPPRGRGTRDSPSGRPPTPRVFDGVGFHVAGVAWRSLKVADTAWMNVVVP